nr:DUF11 domain-containing protein [Chitinophagales bacterium]
MNLKKYLLTCCALFICLLNVASLKAQSIYFSPPLLFNSQYPCGISNEVRAEQITEDQLGILWMIGKDSVNRSLYSYNGAVWTSYPIPFDFWDYRELEIDASGNKWIGTKKHGLIKFDGSSFELYNAANSALQCDDIKALKTDLLGNIWVLQICSFNMYLTKINNGTWETFNQVQTGFEFCNEFRFTPDNLGNVYFKTHKSTCTQNNFIVKFDGANYDTISGYDNHIFEMTCDSQGNLYALFRFDPNDGSAIKQIGVYDGNQWTYYKQPEGLSSGTYLRAMTTNDIIYKKGKLWMYNNQRKDFHSFSFSDSVFTFYETNIVYNAKSIDFTVADDNKIWFIYKTTGEVLSGDYVFPRTVSGTVFLDANENGILDNNESGIEDVIVTLNPEGVYATTNDQGFFEFGLNDTTLTHEVVVNLPPYSYFTNSTGTYEVVPSSQSITNLEFGFNYDSTITDVGVSLSSTPPVPGFNRTIYATATNYGYLTISDTLTVTADSFYQNITDVNPAPLSVSGNTVKWLYSFAQNASITFSFDATVDLAAPLGTFTHSTAIIEPVADDTVPQNNFDTLEQEIVSSYDPNEKTAESSGPLLAGDAITYTIQFQNTGNYPASFVIIRDTLDANLDPASIQILGHSHPMSWSLSGVGYLEFNFENINLPDSSTDEAGSHGFIQFSIRTKAGLPVGSIITNEAFIYFDYNPEVATNVTTNKIENVTFITTPPSS